MSCFLRVSALREQRALEKACKVACLFSLQSGPLLPPPTMNFRPLSLALIFPPGLVEPEEGPPVTGPAQLSRASFHNGLWHFPFLLF